MLSVEVTECKPLSERKKNVEVNYIMKSGKWILSAYQFSGKWDNENNAIRRNLNAWVRPALQSVHKTPYRFVRCGVFYAQKNFGRPCRAPNPEVGCEPGGVIHVLFENPSVSRFFLCILQSSAGKHIAFMPPSRKFLQKFPHHRRLTQP